MTLEALQEVADTVVRDILRQRLKAADVEVPRDEWFFGTSPMNVGSSGDGLTIRVRTWRHWSDTTALADLEVGDVEGWAIPRRAEPGDSGELSMAQAAAVVDDQIGIPTDAVADSLRRVELAPGLFGIRIEWVRVVDGIRVDGDRLVVTVHPRGWVIDCFRKWRSIRVVHGELPSRRQRPGA